MDLPPFSIVKAEKKFLDRLKNIVEAGGGVYLGVQESILPNPPMLIFSNPKSNHPLTVQLPFDAAECPGFPERDLVARVHDKIKIDSIAYEKRSVFVPVATLVHFEDQLSQLSKQVSELFRRKQ